MPILHGHLLKLVMPPFPIIFGFPQLPSTRSSPNQQTVVEQLNNRNWQISKHTSRIEIQMKADTVHTNDNLGA